MSGVGILCLMWEPSVVLNPPSTEVLCLRVFSVCGSSLSPEILASVGALCLREFSAFGSSLSSGVLFLRDPGVSAHRSPLTS